MEPSSHPTPGQCVREAEGYDQKLEQAVLRANGHQRDGIRVEADLVASRAKIEGGINCCLAQAVEGLVNARERVAILDSLLIQGSIVDAQAQATGLGYGEVALGSPTLTAGKCPSREVPRRQPVQF